MIQRYAIVALLVAAALGIAVLFVGKGGGKPGDGARRKAGAGKDEGMRTAPGRPGAGGAGVASPASGSPRLFGRSAAERVGKGGVTAKVVDFRTGAPVGGASLLLAGTGHAKEPVQARSKTGADGLLSFADVPAGEGYSLRVEAEGHPARTLPAVEVQAASVTDLGTIWLGKKGVLAGIVLDPEGNGVPDAVVRVFPGQGALFEMLQDFMEMIGRLDREETPAARGTTDRTGKFVIEGVDPGPMTVLAAASGFGQRGVQAAMTSEGAAGGELRIVLQRGQFVAGKVLDARGGGIGGARVAVITGNEPDSWLYGRTFAETASDGAFRIDTLPLASDVTAIVAAAGYPTTLAELKPGEAEARIVLHRAVPVVVRVLQKGNDAPIEGAHVVLAVGDTADMTGAPGTLVSGHTDAAGRVALEARPGKIQMAIVTHPQRSTGMWTSSGTGGFGPGMLEGPKDGTVGERGGELVFRMPNGLVVTGRVTSPEGEPIVGARCSTLAGMGISKPVLTDADGRYRLVASSMGEGMAFAMVLVRATGWVQPSGSVQVQSSEPKAELVHDVKMERSAVVTGRVVDRNGKGLAGAAVVLRGAPGGDDMEMGFAAMFGSQSAWTAEDGTYVLDTVRAGDKLRATARVAGYVEGRTDEFPVKAGESVRAPDVVLRRGAAITIRVVTPSGAPVARARVEAELQREEPTAFDMMEMLQSDEQVATDASGVARLRNLGKGKATVTASAKGWAPARATLDVPADEDAERTVEVRLREEAPVQGRVLDAEGKPLEGASVQTIGQGDGDGWVPSRHERTGADGAFRLGEIPAVAVQVMVSKQGFQARTVAFEARRGPQDVRLAPEDPDKARRRQELTRRMTELWQQLQDAKDDAERKSIQQQIRDVQMEMGRLGNEGAAVAMPSDAEPSEPGD